MQEDFRSFLRGPRGVATAIVLLLALAAGIVVLLTVYADDDEGALIVVPFDVEPKVEDLDAGRLAVEGTVRELSELSLDGAEDDGSDALVVLADSVRAADAGERGDDILAALARGDSRIAGDRVTVVGEAGPTVDTRSFLLELVD